MSEPQPGDMDPTLKWAIALADRIYNLGDWFSIHIVIIYTLALSILFLKYRARVKYDKVALTVLILQLIAFIALMARSIIALTGADELFKFQMPFTTLS